MPKLEQIGLQLSTVTPLLLEDFEGTLKKVAEIGYDMVELSAMGFLGRSPAHVKSQLALNQLTAPVGRVAPPLPDNFTEMPRKEAIGLLRERSGPNKLVDNVKYSLEGVTFLGQKYLNLPVLMPDNFKTLDQVKHNIEQLNLAGEICAEACVQFGYHNHSWELKPVEGIIPYDMMLNETDSEKVGFQLDVYWIVKGGGDPSHYFSTYPGRFPTCHLKDMDESGEFEDVGSGKIDFPAFVREARAQGSQYFFVEHDKPEVPLESIARSYTYLRQMTY